MSRPEWDKYFLSMCDFVSDRGTCPRKQVGSVIVKDKKIIATGYNGSLPGMPHCDEVGCDMDGGHCVRCVHSEENVISQVVRDRGVEFTKDCILYCNTRPCWECFQVILLFSDIKHIVYRGDYRSDNRIEDAIKYLDGFVFRKVE